MTAQTKLTVLERAHTLLMLTAGIAVGWLVLRMIPTGSGAGVSVKDVLELAVAMLTAYGAAFATDTLIDLTTRPLRRRLRRAAERAEATAAVDMDVVRRAAEAVNRGDVDEADRLVDATGDPQAHAFAAFRYIDVEGER